jgi:protein O-GlcNAc transferase
MPHRHMRRRAANLVLVGAVPRPCLGVSVSTHQGVSSLTMARVSTVCFCLCLLVAFAGGRPKKGKGKDRQALANKWSAQGVERRAEGDTVGAIQAFDRTLKYRRTGYDLHNLASLLSSARQDYHRASELYDEAIALEPQNHALQNNAAAVFSNAGQRDKAIRSYKAAWKLSGQRNELYGYNYGLTLIPAHRDKQRGDDKLLVKARKILLKVVQLNPNFPEAFWKLGIVEEKLGAPAKAVQHFRTCLKLDQQGFSRRLPKSKVYYELHDSLLSLSPTPDFTGAIDSLQQAIVHGKADMYGTTKHPASQLLLEYQCALTHLMRYSVRYEGLEDAEASVYHMLKYSFQRKDKAQLAMTPMRALAYLDANMLASVMRNWGHSALAQRANTAKPFVYASRPHGMELRIGLVSFDFGSKHPMMHLLDAIFPLFENRREVRVFVYALGPEHPTRRAPIDANAKVVPGGIFLHDELAARVHKFTSLYGLSDYDAARAIFNDAVDVLIDLNGFTNGGRPEMFAYRPGRIQVGFLGWPCTIGSSELLDFAFVDPKSTMVESVALKRHYEEKLLIVPPSLFVGDHRRKLPRPQGGANRFANRSALNIPNKAFVFANHNQLFKLNEALLDTWGNILRRARTLNVKCIEQNPSPSTGVLLWLLRHPSAAEVSVREELIARGVPKHHVLFSDFAPQDEYVGRVEVADVFLDNVQYNAGATGVDTFWAGVPMVSMPGDTFVRRMGKSLAAAVNGSEGIVYSLKEYEDLAVAFATKCGQPGTGAHHGLKHIRKNLKAGHSHEGKSLFNTTQWADKFVRALRMAVDTTTVSSSSSTTATTKHCVVV